MRPIPQISRYSSKIVALFPPLYAVSSSSIAARSGIAPPIRRSEHRAFSATTRPLLKELSVRRSFGTGFGTSGTGHAKRMNVRVGGQWVQFDHLFLRDACSCPRCVHPSTQQKLFQTTDIPVDIRPQSAETLVDGSLRILWKNDIPTFPEHESHYSADFLRRYSTMRNRVRARYNDQRQILWDKKMMENDLLYIDYADYMNSDKAVFRAVKQLSLYGLMFIRGIPEGKHDAIEGMANRIGNLKNTFYGMTWDVKSIKDSKNIA
jgi:gamma-butyrobetaine dioxygenase